MKRYPCPQCGQRWMAHTITKTSQGVEWVCPDPDQAQRTSSPALRAADDYPGHATPARPRPATPTATTAPGR